MRLRIGLHSSSRHPVNWSCLHHTDWSVDHTHGTNWWSGRGSWWSKEKLIDPDLIQNLFWVSITLYKWCVLRICRSEQAICIWCHGPPLGRLPSSICFRSWIGVWLFKPILPYSGLLQQCPCCPFHFIFQKDQFLCPSILLRSGSDPVNTMNCRTVSTKSNIETNIMAYIPAWFLVPIRMSSHRFPKFKKVKYLKIQECSASEQPCLLSHRPLREVGMCPMCVHQLQVRPLLVRLSCILLNNEKFGWRFYWWLLVIGSGELLKGPNTLYANTERISLPLLLTRQLSTESPAWFRESTWLDARDADHSSCVKKGDEVLWVQAVRQHVLFHWSHPVQMELPPQTHHPDHQMIRLVDPQHRMFLAIQCGGRLVVWIVGWRGLRAFLPPVGTPHGGPFEGASTDPEHQFYSRFSDENNSRCKAKTYCLSSIDNARLSHREPTPVGLFESDADPASTWTCWVLIISITQGTFNCRCSADVISCSHFFCATAEIVDDNWV